MASARSHPGAFADLPIAVSQTAGYVAGKVWNKGKFVKSLSDVLARRMGIEDLGPTERQQLVEAFDSAFYMSENPELADSGIDPFVHYMTDGWQQCRNPSANFNTLDYLLENRDVLQSGSNPFACAVLGKKVALKHSHRIDAASPALRPTASTMPAHLADVGTSAGKALTPESPADVDWETIPKASAMPSGCEKLSTADIRLLREKFDSAYYLQHNLDVVRAGVDPFQHYMSVGWRELRDPSRNFSTKFYLSYYPDIEKSGMNPFIHWVLHGIKEKRASISFRQRLEFKHHEPMVSAIVPNFNHSEFLVQRLESILNQTYPHISITILDDCSTDDSRELIESYVDRYPGIIRAIYNDENSGGVFRQWRKGVLETDGDLVWICESDDFCEPDFVDRLVPHFRDESVQIAFGRVTETNAAGEPNSSLDEFRERAEPGIWNGALVRPAAAWFAGAFGVRNVVVNVGGCIWRRAHIPDTAWDEAASYSVVGDWYLYIQIAAGGQIAWEPEAVSYFRRHKDSTSGNSWTSPKFYKELERLMLALRSTWEIPAETVRRFHENIAYQYDEFEVHKEYGPIEKHCSLTKLLAAKRTRPHILIAMYGFIPGGGENFPIFLANGLVGLGWTVSMLILETSEVNMHMRRALNPAVSVYESSWLPEYGAERFLHDAGISLVHSHTAGVEFHFFYMWRIQTDVRFLVTLHGSYEASGFSSEQLNAISSPVDHFVYTADKNLLPLEGLGIADERFTKMANAMPIDPEPFPKTRAEMGIAEDAIVFTLVARGIKRKGWRAAIEAFVELRDRHPSRPMHLCLVGEGEEPDRHEKKYGRDPDISFLGYQSRISGLYRMTDVAVVPTRFSGESYPLCIIQALQTGTPVIGSDVGEIRRMLVREDGLAGGLVIDAVRDTREFIGKLANAMEKMLDPELRSELAKGAAELGHVYDMDTLVKKYGKIYHDLLERSHQHGTELDDRSDVENGESDTLSVRVLSRA